MKNGGLVLKRVARAAKKAHDNGLLSKEVYELLVGAGVEDMRYDVTALWNDAVLVSAEPAVPKAEEDAGAAPTSPSRPFTATPVAEPAQATATNGEKPDGSITRNGSEGIAKETEGDSFNVLEESEEEKILWEKRALLEKKIEKKMKMIDNGRERLACGGRIGVFERVEQEIGIMQEEIGRIRDEIALVDRKIRVAERKEIEERREEAEGVDWVAKEAKEYADALGRARQRMEAEVRTIRDLERKLKEVGKI